MKKAMFLFMMAICVFCMTGCVSSMYIPLAVTENPIGTKVGQCHYLEGAILKAAQNGGITRIATVDMYVTSMGDKYYVVSGE